MKWFILVLLVAVSQASVLKEATSVEELAAPIMKKLVGVDPMGLKVEWEPVKSVSEPILGYKVKLWEQPMEKVFKYEVVNGVKVLVEEIVPAKFPLSSKPPAFEPKEVILTKPNVYTAQSLNHEAGLIYEFRVQAYTKSGDGPLSSPMRLQYQKAQDDDHKKDIYIVA